MKLRQKIEARLTDRNTAPVYTPYICSIETTSTKQPVQTLFQFHIYYVVFQTTAKKVIHLGIQAERKTPSYITTALNVGYASIKHVVIDCLLCRYAPQPNREKHFDISIYILGYQKRSLRALCENNTRFHSEKCYTIGKSAKRCALFV